MKKAIITSSVNDALSCDPMFKTIEEADLYIQQGIDNNWWGRPDRWAPSTDGSHTQTREVDNNGEIFTEYFFPVEYTYEITDITTEWNKEELRKAVLLRRAAKRSLANNILDILNDHLDSLDLTETQEDNFDEAIDRIVTLLQKGRPDKIKSKIEAKTVGAVFTQDLKDMLLEEFERFGL